MDVAETKTIKIVLNGEPREAPAGLGIAGLLGWLGMDPSRVAVELNRQMVRKADWPASRIEDGAQVEVVWFVGGGL